MIDLYQSLFVYSLDLAIETNGFIFSKFDNSVIRHAMVQRETFTSICMHEELKKLSHWVGGNK